MIIELIINESVSTAGYPGCRLICDMRKDELRVIKRDTQSTGPSLIGSVSMSEFQSFINAIQGAQK